MLQWFATETQFWYVASRQFHVQNSIGVGLRSIGFGPRPIRRFVWFEGHRLVAAMLRSFGGFVLAIFFQRLDFCADVTFWKWPCRVPIVGFGGRYLSATETEKERWSVGEWVRVSG